MSKKVFKPTGQSNYMGELLQCPCCEKKFADQSIRMHVYHSARAEVWQKAIGHIKKTPHFDLYMKSTVDTKSPKRAWRL